MAIRFETDHLTEETIANITVLGVGGAGGNTINHMINSNYDNVKFVVANTDAQALKTSKALLKLQLGSNATRGRGAGANPLVGKAAAEEDIGKVIEVTKGSDLVFLTAGLGGGTGSGALPVIAHAVREQGILCVAVVTKPFEFEGKRRMSIANEALELLKKEVDTLIVIPNQKLLDLADHKISLVDAFGMINDVIHQFVKSIADINSHPGHINVDFADVCTIMRNMGVAVMGTGCAAGVDRSQKAALQALSSPLLENTNIQGAQAVLLNITGSSKLGLHEVQNAASLVYDAAKDANIIMGSVIDDSMGDQIKVTIIATGLDHTIQPYSFAAQMTPKETVELRPAQTLEQEIETKSQSESKTEKNKTRASYDPQSPLQELEIPTYLRRGQEVQQKQ